MSRSGAFIRATTGVISDFDVAQIVSSSDKLFGMSIDAQRPFITRSG